MPRPGLSLSLALPLALLATGCPKKTPPEPAVTAPSSSADGSGLPVVAPPSSRPTPPAGDAGPAIPIPQREPTPDLDPADPAADYVNRYIRAVNRYGDKTACVAVGKSTTSGGDSTVVVSNPESGSCGPAKEVRDTFVVNVAADRLHLADPSKATPLQKWPDSSDPEGPAAPVREVPDLLHWKSPVRDALKALQLVPIRVQWYGRGTYGIVTLAGWHGDVVPTASDDTRKGIAQKLCAASGGQSMGIFGGLDRTLMLRITCPDKTRWEKF